MDDDEVSVLILSAMMTLFITLNWFVSVARPTRRAGIPRIPLFLSPPICIALCWWVLRHWAEAEVRNSLGYQAMFLCCGVVWMTASGLVFRCFGVSQRDHALPQNNLTAALVISGGWIGTILCFSGANIGQGSTIWTTLGPAAVGTAALFATWFVHALLSRLADRVTIERDVAAGVRATALYVATGTILGRAVAGDWDGTDAFVHDLLRLGWPALLFPPAAAIVDFLTRPTVDCPRPSWKSAGLPPALGYILLAVIILLIEGLAGLKVPR